MLIILQYKGKKVNSSGCLNVDKFKLRAFRVFKYLIGFPKYIVMPQTKTVALRYIVKVFLVLHDSEI